MTEPVDTQTKPPGGTVGQSLTERLTEIATAKDTILWAVGFIGACILVGLGKLDQEVLKYLLFALAGKAAVSNKGAQ